MKKEKAALWLAILMVGISGCGNQTQTEQLVESAEVIVEPKDESNTDDNTDSQKDEGENDKEENVSNENDESSFEGTVKEINKNENFVVVSKIFTEELDGGAEVAVSVVGGGEDEELITVYFTEDTRFQIKTVKNAGEEVTEKEGAFSDIKEESILEFKGKMDAKGEEFLATDVLINEFVYS